jgi:predicted anti-sigma-YlaC factor YlaD
VGVFYKPAQGICGKVWPAGNFSGAPAHYYNMDCDTIRVAISTQIDGEVPWLPADVLETHLAGCPDCRDWQRRAHTVTRRVRLGGAFLDHDLAPGVLAAVPVARDRGRTRLARRGLLIALALAQFAIAAPMLFLGHDREAGLHAAHELGSFNLALAIAFAVGAIRPRLSAGLAWPCAIAAGGLVATAIIDLIGGQAIGPDEAEHLVALAGAALLAWQAAQPGTESAAPAIAAAEGPAAAPGDAEAAPVAWRDRAADRPRGGDAARVTGPAVAARDEGVA